MLCHLAQPHKNPPPGAIRCCATVVHLDSPSNWPSTYMRVCKGTGRADFCVSSWLQSCCCPWGDWKKTPKLSAKAARRQCATSQASRLQRYKSKSCNLKRLQDAAVIERGPLWRTAFSSSLPWGILLQKSWHRDVFNHSRSWTECRTANCCATCILSTDHQLKDCGEKAMALNCSLLIPVFLGKYNSVSLQNDTRRLDMKIPSTVTRQNVKTWN